MAHYAKGTRSPLTGLPFICTYHISGTISSPFRGAFHLSLTVLSAIDLCICLALDGGPPSFRPDYTCPTLLRNTLSVLSFSLTGLSPSMVARSRDVLLKKEASNIEVLQPRVQVRGLGCSPFARHY